MLTLTNDYPWQPSMPSVCYLCGAAPRRDAQHPNGEPIVHTGKYIEMEGFLHICGKCWEEGAGLLGWRDPATVTKLEQEVSHLKADLKVMEERAEAAETQASLLASGVFDSLKVGTNG